MQSERPFGVRLMSKRLSVTAYRGNRGCGNTGILQQCLCRVAKTHPYSLVQFADVIHRAILWQLHRVDQTVAQFGRVSVIAGL